MKEVIIIFAALLATSTALPQGDSKATINENYLKDEPVAYTAEHQIISITVPFYCDDDTDADTLPVFFVEGDPKPNGGYEYQGLYKLIKDQATLILENGRAADAFAVSKNGKLVYIGASDGIYVYDITLNKTEKYGSLTDSILNIAKENGTDVLYILTDDHSVYRVTEGGNIKTKVESIQNAKQIMLDFDNNLYFLDENNLPHIYTEKEIKNVVGLPANPADGQLIKSPFLFKNRVLYISNGTLLFINSYGSNEPWFFDVDLKMSVYSTEASYVQYYANGNKIYKKSLQSGTFSLLKVANCMGI